MHTQLTRFVFKRGGKGFQSLMTQGPDLPEAYPRGNRGVRGKGKRLSHN